MSTTDTLTDEQAGQMAELLPCPFCGEAEINIACSTDAKGPFHWSIVCPKCEASSPLSNTEDTKEKAIEIWNTRAAAPEPARWVDREGLIKKMQGAAPVFTTAPSWRPSWENITDAVLAHLKAEDATKRIAELEAENNSAASMLRQLTSQLATVCSERDIIVSVLGILWPDKSTTPTRQDARDLIQVRDTAIRELAEAQRSANGWKNHAVAAHRKVATLEADLLAERERARQAAIQRDLVATQRDDRDDRLHEYGLPALQARVWRWCRGTFGPVISNNMKERAMRVLEEALELAQAEGVDLATAQRVATRTFSRPVGDRKQEAAQVAVTLLAWSAGAESNLSTLIANELTRIETPEVMERIRQKQAQKFAEGVGVSLESAAPAVSPAKEPQGEGDDTNRITWALSPSARCPLCGESRPHKHKAIHVEAWERHGCKSDQRCQFSNCMYYAVPGTKRCYLHTGCGCPRKMIDDPHAKDCPHFGMYRYADPVWVSDAPPAKNTAPPVPDSGHAVGEPPAIKVGDRVKAREGAKSIGGFDMSEPGKVVGHADAVDGESVFAVHMGEYEHFRRMRASDLILLPAAAPPFEEAK